MMVDPLVLHKSWALGMPERAGKICKYVCIDSGQFPCTPWAGKDESVRTLGKTEKLQEIG